MIEALTLTDLLLRAGLALGMGLAIGWDRERNNKAAGLRTMSLVTVGSAGMMMAAIELAAATPVEQQIDPLRVMQGVIGGIGFLGAGSIIQSRGTIHGMTTAASIWTAAGLGIACGLGLFELAGVLFGMIAIVLIVLTFLKGKLLPEHNQDDEEAAGAGTGPMRDKPGTGSNPAG
jgi:putative Mg2+ transporter-C (MgtC) family protein